MNYENAARQQSSRKWWLRVVGILACIVVFVTVYALVLPAATLEGTPTCGLEEHTHTDACYDADGVLTCTLDEHVHDQACYAEAAEEPDAEDPAAAEPAVPEESAAEPEKSAEPEDNGSGFMMMAAPPVRLGAAGDDGSIMDGRTVTGANDWQIVDGKYQGNDSTNKTPSADNNVRIQKNVIPTDQENEFLVYLSIDTRYEKIITETEFTRYFYEDASRYLFYSSANYGSGSTGNYATGGGSPKGFTPNPNPQHNKAVTLIVRHDGETLAVIKGEVDSGMWNAVFDLGADQPAGKRYVGFGRQKEMNGKGEVTVDLSDEIYNQLVENVKESSVSENSVNIAGAGNGVTDVLGDYVTEFEVVYADGSAALGGDGKTVNWNITPKAHPQQETTTDSSAEGDSSTETTTTWNLNVAELLYKVTLDVEKAGFNSAADNMASSVGDKESYPVNDSAVLSYTVKKDSGNVPGSAAFPQPYVRGLLYDIQGIKVAKGTNAPLADAQFTLAPGDATATSGPDGKFSFKDLPWGDYTVTETQAPQGYRISTDPVTATLCYTTARDSLIQSTTDNTHMMLKDEAKFTFVDELIQPTIVLVKHDEGNNALPGASFEVTGPKSATGTSAEKTGEILTIEEATDGEYKVVETKAPDGYNLLADEVKITVNGTDVKAFVGTKQIDSSDLTKAVDDETGVTTVTIVIHNNSGVVLPETGGTGTLLFTISGLALIASAAVIIVIRRR